MKNCRDHHLVKIGCRYNLSNPSILHYEISILLFLVILAMAMFVLALMVGVAQNLGSLLPSLPPGLPQVYFHLLMVGWVTQFILGVAIWMLPKYSQEKPRGIELLSWATYILLNTGWLIRAFGEPLTEL